MTNMISAIRAKSQRLGNINVDEQHRESYSKLYMWKFLQRGATI